MKKKHKARDVSYNTLKITIQTSSQKSNCEISDTNVVWCSVQSAVFVGHPEEAKNDFYFLLSWRLKSETERIRSTLERIVWERITCSVRELFPGFVIWWEMSQTVGSSVLTKYVQLFCFAAFIFFVCVIFGPPLISPKRLINRFINMKMKNIYIYIFSMLY